MSQDSYKKYGGYCDNLISELYDHLPIYSERGDTGFYVEWANRIGSDVLELGCGTGRISIPVAYTGVKVFGIDYSLPMLQRFNQKLQNEPKSVSNRLYLIRADMTNFNLKMKFDLITIPFRPFQHLVSPEAQINCLLCVREHLTSKGILILDVFNPNPDRLLTPSFGSEIDVPLLELPDGRKMSRSSIVMNAHWAEKWNEYEFIYNIEEVNGESHQLIQHTTMRYYSVEEMELIFEMGGFKIKELYGDFDSSPFGADSPEEIYILEPK